MHDGLDKTNHVSTVEVKG